VLMLMELHLAIKQSELSDMLIVRKHAHRCSKSRRSCSLEIKAIYGRAVSSPKTGSEWEDCRDGAQGIAGETLKCQFTYWE